MNPAVEIRALTLEDYEACYGIWQSADGISLGDDDARDRIALYLRRNAGLCFAAVLEGKVVGCVLCGHDGRRGILRHLAVGAEHRRQGIARRLVAAVGDGLAREGIAKCNLFVMDANPAGLQFWKHMGAVELQYDWRTLQLRIGGR